MFLALMVKGTDAIIEEYQTTIAISSIKSMDLIQKKRVQILNEYGYGHAIFQTGEDKFHKLSSLSMTVYDANGKKVKSLGKSRVVEYGFNSSNEIDDTKILYLDPEYQSYPFTVEIEYTIQSKKGYLSIPSWIPRYGFRLSVESASLTLERPIDFDLKIYEENIAASTKKTTSKSIIESWEVNGLEAIDNDMSFQQFYDEQPKVILGPNEFVLDGYEGSFENWSIFGNWFYQLNSDPYELSEATKAFLDGISDNDPLKNKVQSIYKYMQSRTRYISIQLGIGGYKSLPTEFVDEQGYGDCKALSNYMKSMLDYKDITSNFVLVKAGENVPDVKKDKIINQFNHVFLAIPDPSDTLYLECTNQMSPTGFLGTFTDDRNVLWIEKDKSKIIRSPKYDESINVLKSDCKIEIDKYGNAQIKISRENGGLFYDDIMFYKSTSEEQREHYIYSQFDFKDFIVNDFDFGERVDEKPVFATKYDITVNNMVRNTSDKLLVPINVFPDPDTYFPNNSYKKYASIKRAFTIEDQIIMKMPENFWLVKVPEVAPISSDFGEYECIVEDLQNGSIAIKRKLILKKGEYKEEDFEIFNEFLNEVKKADKTKIILQSGT